MSIVRYLQRFRRARAELAALEERERWPRERIEAYQLARLNELWAHAIANVPYYREMRVQSGLPERFADLTEFRARVPILPSDLVRDDPAALLSECAGRGTWERTSGSQGSPRRVFWDRAAHHEVLRCRYRLYSSWGVDIFGRATYVMGPVSWSGGLRGRVERARWHLKSRLRNRQWLFLPRLGQHEVRSTLEQIARFRPVMLYGFSRTLQLLAAEAERSGVRWPDLRVVILTSEPATPALRRDVSRGFGVPTAVEYGATECGLIAGEAPDGALRVREDIVYVETLSRRDGRRDIVVTVLANPAFPLLRYRIGDVTDGPLGMPETGFATLGPIHGRDDDFLVDTRGALVDSMAVEEVVQNVADVRTFRARQAQDGSVTLWLELAPGASLEDPAGLERALSGFLEGQAVVVESVAHIPASEAGKRRVVVSDLVRGMDLRDRRRAER